MKKKINYYIKHVGGLFELYSVMECSFGGPAFNFVKSSSFESDLIRWAESQGWIKSDIDEVCDK